MENEWWKNTRWNNTKLKQTRLAPERDFLASNAKERQQTIYPHLLAISPKWSGKRASYYYYQFLVAETKRAPMPNFSFLNIHLRLASFSFLVNLIITFAFWIDEDELIKLSYRNFSHRYFLEKNIPLKYLFRLIKVDLVLQNLIYDYQIIISSFLSLEFFSK